MISLLLLVLVIWLIATVLGVPVADQTRKIVEILLIILIVLWLFGGYTHTWPASWPRC
mgnify:CR=1 FL=1